jgi:hypothetical protein
MKKLSHSKYRNTGILFELLVRQVTADILNGSDDSNANKILRTFFSESTMLGKENRLYRIIIEEKIKDQVNADRLLNTVVSTRKKLNESELLLQKYNLIKEIKANYPLDDFLKGNIQNYKLLASVYKIFEDAVTQVQCDPRELFKARGCIVEHMVTKASPTKLISEDEKVDLIKVYQQQNEDVRLLAYKILVDSFNSKYKGLNEKQQVLIREYINNVSNTNSLRQYINSEVPVVSKQLTELKSSVYSNVVRIKIDETITQLGKIAKGSLVKDNHVMAMMLSYELIKELSNIK